MFGRALKFYRACYPELLLAFGTVLTSVVALLGSVFAARWVDPSEMGIMQTLAMVPVYASFLHLGIFNGTNRNAAIYLGKEDAGKIQNIINASWTSAKWVSFIGTIISCLLCIFYWLADYPAIYLLGMVFVGASLIAEPFSLHFDAVYLSLRQFRPLGLRLLWQNALTLLASLSPAVLGVSGFVASRTVYAASRLAARFWRPPIHATEGGRREEVRELAMTGFPLLVAGTLHSFFGIADRSILAWSMSDTDVGHYTLATLIIAGIQFIPTCIATIVYPRVVASYGKNGEAGLLRPYLWLMLGLTFGLMIPISIVLYWTLDWIVQWWMPEYSDGLPAAKFACISSISSAYISCGAILAAVRRNRAYIGALMAALGIMWLLGTHLVELGYGLMGVSYARLVATVVLSVSAFGLAYQVTRPAKLSVV